MTTRTDRLIIFIVESKNRREAARRYSWGLQAGGVNFEKVNTAIVERWSVSGLKYIKRLVWSQL